MALEFRNKNGADLDDYGLTNSSCFKGYLDSNLGAYVFYGDCAFELPLNSAEAGSYLVTVTGWGDQAGLQLPKLGVSFKSDSVGGQRAGALQIKTKIVDLYQRLHGTEYSVTDNVISSTYELLESAWEERKTMESTFTSPHTEVTCLWYDWGLRAQNYDPDKDFTGMKYAWITVLVALMTDFDYLHE